VSVYAELMLRLLLLPLSPLLLLLLLQALCC
jgi:hypothetical protein